MYNFLIMDEDREEIINPEHVLLFCVALLFKQRKKPITLLKNIVLVILHRSFRMLFSQVVPFLNDLSYSSRINNSRDSYFI